MEVFLFEDAHWAVPEDKVSFLDLVFVELLGLRADVDALKAIRDVPVNGLDGAIRGLIELVGDD